MLGSLSPTSLALSSTDLSPFPWYRDNSSYTCTNKTMLWVETEVTSQIKRTWACCFDISLKNVPTSHAISLQCTGCKMKFPIPPATWNWRFIDCSPPILQKIEPTVRFGSILYRIGGRTVSKMSNFISTGQIGKNFLFHPVMYCQSVCVGEGGGRWYPLYTLYTAAMHLLCVNVSSQCKSSRFAAAVVN